MSKKFVFIIAISGVFLLSILTIFVFKARGSNGRDIVKGCVPYNVSISKKAEYEALIEWYTIDECLGYVSYGRDREKMDSIGVNNEELSSRKHEIVIEKLLPSQNYFFIIHSGDKDYGNKGVPLSFSLSSL